MKFGIAVLLSIAVVSVQSSPIRNYDWSTDVSKDIFIQAAREKLENIRLMVVHIVADTYEKIVPISNIGPIKLKIVTNYVQGIVNDLNSLGPVYKACISRYEPTITGLIKSAEDDLSSSIDEVNKANDKFKKTYVDFISEIDSRTKKMPEFVAECEDGFLPNITPCFQKKHDQIQDFVDNVISTMMGSTNDPIQRSIAANGKASEFRQRILEIAELAQLCYTESNN